MRKLTKNIVAETGFQWANVGAAVTEGGVIMIDCPVRPTESRKWQEELRTLSPLGLRYLISTDYHGDHSTGAAFVKGVTYIAPQRVYEEMGKIQGKHTFSRNALIETLRDQGLKEEAEEVAKAAVRLPTVCFEESLILHLPPLTFEIRRVGGHTPACSVVYIPEEKVIFSSDVVMDTPEPGMRDANVGQWLKAMEWIEGLPVDYIVTGHGEIGGKEIIGKLRKYLSEVWGIMGKLVESGKTKAEAVGDRSFGKFLRVDESKGSYWIEHRKKTFQLGLEKMYDDVKELQGATEKT